MNLMLEAEKMTTRKEAHQYLKEMFAFPDYYGRNLDALYDCLTELKDEQVEFYHAGEELEKENYFAKVYRTFLEAAEANSGLVIREDRMADEEESKEEDERENEEINDGK